MKSIYRLFSFLLLSLVISACSSSYQPYAYDDIYYNPANDPVKQVEKDPSQDLNKTDNITYDNSYPNRYTETQNNSYPEGLYQNRYIEAEQVENQSPTTNDNNQTVIINNNTNGDVEYYDEEYAETVRRLNTPVQSFNSYDPYLRSRIAYTNDPFFYGPSMYNTFAFYDPFTPTTGLGIGWNSWSGWNIGIGIGFGYSSWACANPFYNPWRPAFGYNPWNPWGWGWGAGWGYGWGNDPYWAGYNHGYYNGFNNGYFYGDHNSGRGSGRNYISTPRGSSGSRAFTEPRRSTRPQPSNSNYRIESPNRGNARIASPNSQPSNTARPSTENRRSRTPGRYATGKTPETYSNPSTRGRSGSEVVSPQTRLQPSQNSTGASPNRRNLNTRPSTRSRTTQGRPTNEGYNSRRPINPGNTQSIQRQENYQLQPKNNINRSRPTYNSTPTYSPSRSMGGSRPGRSVSPSRSTPSSRPRR